MSDHEDLWEQMMGWEGDEATLITERVRVDPGVSFSPEAMENLTNQMALFVGTRVLLRWNKTNEPPTRLVVHLRVEVA